MNPLKFQNSEVFKVTAEKVFEQHKQKILTSLPIVQVEHIGGTSVYGLLTKGDLDINVRVSSENFETAIQKLKTMYEINQPDNWTPTYASFKGENSEIDLGVQLTVVDSRDDYFIKQRDALVQDQGLVKELNGIKEWCEANNLSMDEYRKRKGDFFERIIRKLDSSSNILH